MGVSDFFENNPILLHNLIKVKHGFYLLFNPRTLFAQIMACGFICIDVYDIIPGEMSKIGAHVNVSVVTFGITFCLVFAIGQSYARREKALESFAVFKSNLASIYFIMITYNQNHKDWLKNWTSEVLTCAKDYLITPNTFSDGWFHTKKHEKWTKIIYNNTLVLTKKIKKMKNIEPPVRNNLYQKAQAVIGNFESLKIPRDYKTPIGIRGFISIMFFCLPFLLEPYFLYGCGDVKGNFSAKWKCNEHGQSFFWAWLYFLILGTLVEVQSNLDDIFDGDSIDDIVINDEYILKLITQEEDEVGTNEVARDVNVEMTTPNGGNFLSTDEILSQI